MNKLASTRASGLGGGSQVLTDLVEGLQEPAVAVELRLKINQNHPDLQGGYDLFDFALEGIPLLIPLHKVTNKSMFPDPSAIMEKQC